MDTIAKVGVGEGVGAFFGSGGGGGGGGRDHMRFVNSWKYHSI